MSDETNVVLLDEERRQAAHQEIKEVLDDGAANQFKREAARAGAGESAELAKAVQALKEQRGHDVIKVERELVVGRTTARVSQVVDYCFYLIYGLITLQFTLRLLGARQGSSFADFVSRISSPLLAPFERIVPTLGSGAMRVELSYLLALMVYILLHLAINGAFRLIAHRKVTV